MNFIGKPLPPFSLKGYCDGSEITMTDRDLQGQYSVLFFYPLDFTFVCPTELIALQDAAAEFASRNARVYAISIDSVHSHRAWCHTPRNQGGVEGVSYPLLSDMHRDLARMLGIYNESEGVALRATFIVDTDNVVQHVSVNNLPFGRNVSEILRLIDAITFVKMHGDQVCPANWEKGKKTLSPTSEGVAEYLSQD